MSGAALTEQILACEQQLLHGDHSGSDALLDRLLAPDFIEVNVAGGITNREDVCRWLRGKDPAARWRYSDFVVVPLGGTACLARYHAIQTEPEASARAGARHVSLWRYSDSVQGWQLSFHQTTRVWEKS